MKSARDLCRLSASEGASALLPTHAEGAATATAVLTILHPCPSSSNEHGANDNSLVLRITHGSHAALFMGDAERWAERRLLATHPGELAADFLKVGHHGSRTSSSPEFLARVAPRFASLSSGIRNRFGHPHAEALAHLERAGARALRLDRLGAIEWQSDGSSQRLRTFASGTAPARPAGEPP